MPATVTVADALRTEAETLMAQRAALTVTWLHRCERELLLGEIDRLLEQWLEAHG